VSIKGKLRLMLLYLPLLAGALSGVPMRPEDIEQLMDATNREEIVQVMPEDDEVGDETIREIRRMIASGGRE
jgi:hypothetical protein